MTPQKESSETQQPARPADPCIMVIFGASGDLTGRKLIPEIYNLAPAGLMPKNFGMVGVAIDKISEDDFRKKARKDMEEQAKAPMECSLCDSLIERISYISGDFKDPNLYQNLATKLAELNKTLGTPGNYFFYLAVAPAFFAEIIKQLGAVSLHCETDHIWRRVVIEKPFGSDLESARNLTREIQKVLAEKQIYRIDHYLGKETVQNILVFRFSNGIFEPVWNRRYIDHVQITVAETLGVEQRGGYYDHAGAARDMVPNHILQLVTLTAMEPPISFGADAVRDEQAKILHVIQPLAPEDVLTRAVRGQYGEGQADGQPAPAYRTEPHVDPASQTETFVALKLSIDNWRW